MTDQYYHNLLHIVPTRIQWSLPEDNLLQGNLNVSGNCTLTSNPPPAGELNIMNCDYQTFTTIVDKYTVTISFIIYHVTHVLQSCLIYCRSSTHEEERTLVIGNTTDNLNKSIPTPPGGVPNRTTSYTSISNITTPTSHDNASEQGVKVNAARDTDHESNQEQIATVMIMLILVVVSMLILILLTVVTVILVVCMTIRVMNMPQKQQI